MPNVMEIILPKKTLLATLEAAVAVTAKKSPDPLATQACLKVTTGQLVLTGTDNHRSVTSTAAGDGVEVIHLGGVALPARDLLARVKFMPEGPVQIQVEEGYRTTVRAVGAARRFILSGSPADEYPQVPTRGDNQPTMVLPGAALANLIRRVQFAVSQDETRPHVNSALFEVSPTRIRLVATDGHRAACAERPVAGIDLSGQPSVAARNVLEILVPLRGLSDVTDLAGTGDIIMTLVERDVFFEADNTVLALRLPDAQFPPYKLVMEVVSNHHAIVSRLKMTEVLNAVSLAASDKTGGVRLTFRFGRLGVDAADPAMGSGHDEMDINYSGPETAIGVSAKYVVDALKGLEPREGTPGAEKDEVRISFSGELDPILFAPALADPELIMSNVVMPMRI